MRVTEFNGCEEHVYGTINMKKEYERGYKINGHEKLLSINKSEVFAGIKVVGNLNIYGWWED